MHLWWQLASSNRKISLKVYIFHDIFSIEIVVASKLIPPKEMLKLIKKLLLFSLVFCCLLGQFGGCGAPPSAAQTAAPLTASPSASVTPTPSPTASVTPTPTPTATSTPKPSPTNKPKATPVIYVPTDLFYKNESMGFTLEFPAEWKDRYIVEEWKGYIRVFSKKTRENYAHPGNDGFIFSIERFTGELITEELVNTAVSGKIILRGNGYSYVVRTTYDGPFITDDEKLRAEYKDLCDKRAEVYQSIKLLGTAKPKASNAGYKVLGTDFFIAEIPEEWDIKESTDTIVCWDIYSASGKIGSIQIIPYKSEIIASDDKTMREYILSDNFHFGSNTLITLSTKEADADTMQKVKSGLKLTGFLSVVYVESLANRYLELGGIKIFGKIDSFKIENNRFTAVNIRKMNYVPDNSAKGFHIEDLNEIITYPMDSPMLAPLVGPDYKSYGTYKISSVNTKSFFNDCPNYKDSYFDFIIGDNMVKVVLERYIP